MRKVLGLSPKHVTLSTSVIVPGIDRGKKNAPNGVSPERFVPLSADTLMSDQQELFAEDSDEACRNYPLRNWEQFDVCSMLAAVNTRRICARVVRLFGPLTAERICLPWKSGDCAVKESARKRLRSSE